VAGHGVTVVPCSVEGRQCPHCLPSCSPERLGTWQHPWPGPSPRRCAARRPCCAGLPRGAGPSASRGGEAGERLAEASVHRVLSRSSGREESSRVSAPGIFRAVAVIFRAGPGKAAFSPLDTELE